MEQNKYEQIQRLFDKYGIPFQSINFSDHGCIGLVVYTMGVLLNKREELVNFLLEENDLRSDDLIVSKHPNQEYLKVQFKEHREIERNNTATQYSAGTSNY